MKRTSTIQWTMPYPVEDIWQVVTNNRETSWRTDIEKLTISDETNFIEYYAGGGETHFTITKKETFDTYQFVMKNKFFNGEWTGQFISLSENTTKLVFTETLFISNPLTWLASFLMMNLKKMQTAYMIDLEKQVDLIHKK